VCSLYTLLLAPALSHSSNSAHSASLVQKLLELDQLAPQIVVHIPREILVYVQEGRNPEIYTREFVELIMRQNQKLKGKADAFAQFRDILAREWSSAAPDLKPQIREVVHSTGGSLEI
jgi:mediator of RNA polymerase II transcription subunit 10